MPMHEYHCQECGDEFELLVRSGDTPACPSCQSSRLERLLSMFAVNSEGKSRAALRAAQQRYRDSKDRKERLQHEGQQIREHLQEDYGVDVSRPRTRRDS